MTKTPWRVLHGTSAFMLLVACESFPDLDLRSDLGSGFDTSAAVADLPNRPRPDARGVISYPNYQMVVAQRNDTIRSIAARLGLDVATLAAFNGIDPDVLLRRDELVALPARVSEPSGGPIQPVDITAVASSALERAGPQAPVATSTLPDTPTPAPAPQAAQPQAGTEPIRHKVKRGETVFSISRLYNVPVRNIAEWNGLSAGLAIREDQFLLIPQGGAPAPSQSTTQIEAPGTGSVTPIPPSAAAPLPDENPVAALSTPAAPAAPDLGTATQATQSTAARFVMPVDGTIIRAYAQGRNEGIDIGVAAGTPVKAADAGTVAAVTKDTAGVAIVVIKHADNLLTVYTNLDDLTVEKNTTVSRGQTLGKVRAGDPAFVHFEVRRGLQSVDPADYLP